MTIKKWPEQERPRERLIKCGASALSDTELLAIIIGSGTKKRNALEIARALLADFGSLRAIIEADRKQLCAAEGFGTARFVFLQAAVEIVRRSLLETIKKGNLLTSPAKTRDYLTLKMRHHDHEVFACLFLDNQNRVLAFEEMFHGTIDGASVHPREIVKRVLYHNAAAIILVHNHPSGCNEPSLADERITQEVKQVLRSIDVRVLDHFVVGEKITSLAEREML